MRAGSAIVILLPIAAAVWAFAPAKCVTIEHPDGSRTPAEEPPTALAVLDRGAFGVPLWVAPAAPPAPPVTSPPPPPLKLQLLAIVQEGGSQKAMLYDPDSDTVLVAGNGDTVVGKKVEKVTAFGVQLRDGNGLRILALRTDQTGATP